MVGTRPAMTIGHGPRAAPFPLRLLSGRTRTMRWPCAGHALGRCSDRERLAPAQARDGLAGRAVFTADPALVAEFVHAPEHEAPADFAGAWLIAGRHIGDLHMRDDRHELFHALG